MNDISNISSHIKSEVVNSSKDTAGINEDVAAKSSKGVEAQATVDQAEFSEIGQLMGAAQELPDVRAEKVAEIRLALSNDEEGFIRDRLGPTADRLIAEVLG